jgi:hypothetical protein
MEGSGSARYLLEGSSLNKVSVDEVWAVSCAFFTVEFVVSG